MSFWERLGGRSPLEGASKPELSLPSWQLALAVFAGLLYLTWAIYTSASQGIDRGLGVLVSWPTLALLAALVVAPFIGLWMLIGRLRSWRAEAAAAKAAEAEDEDDEEDDEDEDAAEEEDEDEEEEDEGEDDDEDEDEDEDEEASPASDAEAKAAK
jgi:cytoskeletal protein RodZ